MKILMFEVPTIERDGSVPFGVLYAASSVLRAGHDVRIIDLVKKDYDYRQLQNIISDYKPEIIGMGGITSSYRNCKELIGRIKDDFKDIPVVVGGVISSVSDILLERAGADYVVHGEGERSFPELVRGIENGVDMESVNGISFIRNGAIIRTKPQEQVGRLDDIPLPDYGLLDMELYLEPAEKWVQKYFAQDDEEYERIRERADGKRYLFPIITARGCTHKCIFCYRHHKGLRQHSVPYVLSMMRHLHDNYQVDVFQINDELTTGNKAWMMEFCNAIRNEALDVLLVILSARVDNVDQEMLVVLRETGCVMINYGYESGSDIILREIRKGVTRKQALETGLLTKKVGIRNVPEIIIGFPSETEDTVADTIDFLKRLDTWPISVNTPIPFPETPLWQYAVEHNLIRDKEEFVSNYRRGIFVNFTRFSDNKVRTMAIKVKYATLLHWLRKRKKFSLYCMTLIKSVFLVYIRPFLPGKVNLFIQSLYLRLSKPST